MGKKLICGYVKGLFIASLLLLIYTTVQAQATCGTANNIGGRIFYDYNFNGQYDEAAAAIRGVTVQAYGANNLLLGTAISDIDGNYVIAVPDGQRVRLEFTGIPTGMSDGYQGTANGTTVQFVTSPTCQANLGLSDPAGNCSNSPSYILPCYVPGNTMDASVSTRDALVRIGYNQRGEGANYATDPPTAGAGGMPTALANAGKVGALWGTAYDRRSNTAFVSAVVKRFSGFGPLGVGGIYMVSDATGAGTTSNFLDVAPCLGMAPLPRPDLPTTATAPSYDEAAYMTAGLQGIGGMAVSEDGLYLYFVDLTNRQLVQMRLRNTPGGPLLPASCANIVRQIPVPAIAGCTSGNTRPWAVEVYAGKVYVGAVCSNVLVTQVFEWNPASPASPMVPKFTTAPSLSAYTFKGCGAGVTDPANPNGYCCTWNTWLGPADYTFDGTTQPNALFICHPQPILANISFDVDGSMILSYMDRFGLQVGWKNYHPPGSVELYDGMTGGDLLYAYNDRGTYVLNLGKDILDASGNVVRTGCGDSNTWGGVEFYCSDNLVVAHSEGFQGGADILRGSGQMLGTFVDPGFGAGGSQNTSAGGVIYTSNTTGAAVSHYEVFFNGGSGTLGKALGLGDLTFMCPPSPMEIGNRIWNDLDKDGIQDPTEPPIPGVTVILYNTAGTQVATTVTAADGTWYFNNATTTALMENTDYYAVVGNYNAVTGMTLPGYLGYTLTTTNTGTNDLHDNDATRTGLSGAIATAVNGRPYIAVRTGILGQNNHSYDFGFYNPSCFINDLRATIGDCNALTNPATVTATISFEWFNVTPGNVLRIVVNGQTRNYTATTVDGNASFVFLVPPGQASLPASVTNMSVAGCNASITFSSESTLLSATTSASPCSFNDTDLKSYTTVSVTVNWTSLNVGDVIYVKDPSGNTVTYTVTTTSGSQVLTIQELANGMNGQPLEIGVQGQPCTKIAATYNSPPSCQQCVLQIKGYKVGECVYNPSTLQSTTPLDVEVFWYTPSALPTTINVTVNGVTNSIPVTVSQGNATTTFTVPADGSTSRPITAVFANNSSCARNTTYDASPPCAQRRDLMLSKTVSSSTSSIGQTLTWTLVVLHQGNMSATGVQVTDAMPAGLTYAGSYTATQGSFNGSTWTIGTMAIGSTATLTFQTTTAQQGVFYNTAQVSAMNEPDVDSRPNNNAPLEDDYDEDCVSVPFTICDGEEIEVRAETGYYDYIWYRNNVQVATGQTYIITQPGTYQYSAHTTPGGSTQVDVCCPIQVVAGTCPCEVNIADVNVGSCVEGTLPTTVDVVVCVDWANAPANNTVSVTVAGTTTPSTTQTLTGQASVGAACFVFAVRPGDALTINAGNGTCNATPTSANSPGLCPPCTLNYANLTSSLCNYDPVTNTSKVNYTFNLTWSNLSPGDVIVVQSATLSTYVVPTASGSTTLNATGLATGAPQSIIVYVQNKDNCTLSIPAAPLAACDPLSCAVSIDNIMMGLCYNNTVNTTVTVSWQDATPGNTLTVTVGGVSETLTIAAGNAANGSAALTLSVPTPLAAGTATASLGPGCSATRPYSAVAACPPCTLNLQVTVNDCYYDAVNMQDRFTANVCATWANVFSGDNLVFQLGDNILIPEQQDYIHVVSGGASPNAPNGTGCVTLTAPVFQRGNMDIRASFNVTPCNVIQTITAPICCPTITNPSAAQNNCVGTAGSPLVVTTEAEDPNSIRFVRFTSAQTDEAIIYSGGTTLGTATPTGGTATLNYNWSNTAPGTYYVYVILNPNPSPHCMPYQQIVVTIAPPITLAVTDGTICSGGSIDLATLVTSTSGTTLSYHTTLADANAGANPLAYSTVSPANAKHYYIRSQTIITGGQACYTVRQVTITLRAPSCGTIQVNGPN